MERKKTYWYVKGDYRYILEVSKLLFNTKKYEDFANNSSKYSRKPRIYGAYLSDTALNNSEYSYWIFTKEDMEEARDSYDEEAIFEGELRIENGKLIKDTLASDIIKYNL